MPYLGLKVLILGVIKLLTLFILQKINISSLLL
jgi:hypothetical protein